METLANLQSFVRSAEAGSFSAAARRLALTPAAVSRNVAQLEANLGVRLFQRSTRKLTLTEAGERFLHRVSGGLNSVQAAIDDLTQDAGQPAGVLKLSASLAFARDFLLPLMPAFIERYPAVLPDWQLDNRPVQLIADGYDAAIGGGLDLQSGMVARELAPMHLVAVASPAYVQGKPLPTRPAHLQHWDGIVMRSANTGRLKEWSLRAPDGGQELLQVTPRLVINDPDALANAAILGMGVTMLAMSDAVAHLNSGALVRVLPGWYADGGIISLYFAGNRQLPGKTRAFIDHITGEFQTRGWAKLLAGH